MAGQGADDRKLEMEIAEELGLGHLLSDSDEDWREKLTEREVSLLTRALLRKTSTDGEQEQ